MANTVSALVTAVSADDLVSCFSTVVPYVAVAVIASLTLMFIRKLVKGVAKGKTKI